MMSKSERVDPSEREIMEALGALRAGQADAILGDHEILVVRAVEAQRSLERSEARYRSMIEDVLDNAAVGILVVDADRSVVWANTAYASMVGMSRDGLIGVDRLDLLDRLSCLEPDCQDRLDSDIGLVHAKMIREAYSGKRDELHFECRIKDVCDNMPSSRWDSAGALSYRVIEFKSRRIGSGLYAGGRVEYIYDITDRVRLESDLHRAQKLEAVGHLAGGIAHEFNNLLTVMNGYAEILSSTVETHSDLAQGLEAIHVAGMRAADLVNQLLSLAGRQTLQMEPVNVNHIIRDAAHLITAFVGQRSAHQLVLSEQAPVIQGARDQLQMVLLAMLDNAAEALAAMPQIARKIKITTRLMPAQEVDCAGIDFNSETVVVIEVADNGVGMSEEVKQRAFEPFYTTKDVGKGLGLGLAVAIGIARQHGGTMTLESQLGEGTVVRALFPSDQPAPAPQKPQSQEKRTALVVDDTRAVRALTATMLKSAGYVVLEADGGKAALAAAASHDATIELVVTDLHMPDMDGIEVIQTLRAAHGHMAAVIVSGFVTIGAETLGGLERTVALAKPFRRQDLLGAVRRATAE